MSTPGRPEPRAELPDARWRPFRPFWGRLAAWVVGTIAVGGTVLVGLTTDGSLADTADKANKVSFVVFAGLVALLLWRLGGVHAVPGPSGLLVRNLVVRRRLAWPQIVEVRMGPNDPWVRLDLSDGGTIAVMGIQRSDGERGMSEARRLRALVSELGEATDPTGSPGS